jgi:hypothetical protein
MRVNEIESAPECPRPPPVRSWRASRPGERRSVGFQRRNSILPPGGIIWNLIFVRQSAYELDSIFPARQPVAHPSGPDGFDWRCADRPSGMAASGDAEPNGGCERHRRFCAERAARRALALGFSGQLGGGGRCGPVSLSSAHARAAQPLVADPFRRLGGRGYCACQWLHQWAWRMRVGTPITAIDGGSGRVYGYGDAHRICYLSDSRLGLFIDGKQMKTRQICAAARLSGRAEALRELS